MKGNKIIERQDFTKLNRGHKYTHNGIEITYSKMVKGEFFFRDGDGNPVKLPKSEYDNIQAL